jgi:Domain of unknown function (DUF4386)
MNSSRTAARIAGILFIIAAVTSVVALILYQPILGDPDYIVKGSPHEGQIASGALLELVLAASVVGISITLFPFLKRINESLALGYVCFRVLEAVVITVGIISLLSALTLSQDFTPTANPAPYQISGKLLVAMHDWTFLLGPQFMLGISTTTCGYLLYRSKLVPRFIAICGLTGGATIFLSTCAILFGWYTQLSTVGVTLAIPVAFYEMTLAVWLIVKGFNATTADPIA